jgi:hypothetical protein
MEDFKQKLDKDDTPRNGKDGVQKVKLIQG